MAPKRFDARRNDATPKEFILAYQRNVAADGEPEVLEDREDTFTALATSPAGVMVDFAAAGSQGGGKSAAALVEFLAQTLIDGDVDRFAELVRDKRVQIPVQTLGEIVEWLVAEYANRPTLPS